MTARYAKYFGPPGLEPEFCSFPRFLTSTSHQEDFYPAPCGSPAVSMAFRLRRLKEVSGLVLKIYSGANGFQSSKGGVDLLYLHLQTSRRVCTKIINMLECGDVNGQRYLTVAKRIHEPPPEADFLSFIQSAMDKLQGPSHLWLNKIEVSKCLFKKDGIFLVLAGQFIGDAFPGCNSTTMFEKLKLLQQRYPSLQIMGFQYSQSMSSDAVSTGLIQKIMIDYITFPVLLSNKDFSEMKDGACYIMFKGFHDPLIYHAKDVDLVTLDKAIKVLTMERSESSRLVNKLESAWVNPTQTVKEPYLSSSLRNLLLYFPGCISVDEGGNRLFLSDVNHHRIIIFDNNGKILDSIGSSPGFEDAEFENAKLLRPAASFYHASDDCLYFVDSENHAIRKADMERRVIETIYPANTVKKTASLWSWILDKFGMKQDAETKFEEFHPDSLLFPWHLMKSNDNDLFVLNRSFETLWIMDLTSGIIREVVKGFPNVLEICGQMIKERAFLTKHMPDDWLLQQMNTSYSLDGIPHAGLISSIAKFKDYVVICDAAGQMVWRLDVKLGSTSSFQFSNFGVLGLPYWCSFPLEKVFAADEVLPEMHIDHIESFRLLPGRVTIVLNVDIPEDVDVVEPLEENSVWCHARGSAIEVSGAESRAASLEKVGVAQQWYDEIDNLTFTTSEIDSSMEAETRTSDGEVEEGRVCINCVVSTSPGTSEVIIYAPLYLKLKRSPNSSSDGLTERAARLAEILDPIGMPRRDSIFQFLLTSNKSLHDLVFLKPLHVRLKFECANHPKADNSKNVILTDSSIDVKVAF